MERLVKISLVVVGVLSAFGSVVYGQPWLGSGVEGDPYQIWTAGDMQAIGGNSAYWDAHFELMADIDLSAYTGTSFNIIGYYLSGDNPFTGVFDGNGHTISNFTYTSTGTSTIGLFGYIAGDSAEVKDLGLINAEVDAGTGGEVGSLVACLWEGGTVSDCYVEGGSVSGGSAVGGLVGGSGRGTITNCYSTGSVSGTDWVGGLVGKSSGTITNCYSTGSVSGTWNVGGLVGGGGAIFNCYSTCDVLGEGYVGGLVGSKSNYGTVSNCYATGSISGTTGVGGL